ncbi:MAG: hypothetical protein LWX07_04150 [Bacteroidetes bacterium]|nr:hypothetical protein [Bacteroidota bacterium]
MRNIIFLILIGILITGCTKDNPVVYVTPVTPLYSHDGVIDSVSTGTETYAVETGVLSGFHADSLVTYIYDYKAKNTRSGSNYLPAYFLIGKGLGHPTYYRLFDTSSVFISIKDTVTSHETNANAPYRLVLSQSNSTLIIKDLYIYKK